MDNETDEVSGESPQDSLMDPTLFASEDETAESSPPSVDVDFDESAFAAAGDAKAVIGDDDRKLVPDTTRLPYAATAFLKVYFPAAPAKTFKMCTGTLIAEDAVLTAAHCIYEHALGGRAVAISVTPGLYIDDKGKQRTLANVGSSAVKATHFEGFNDKNGYGPEQIPSDYAVLRLERPLGKQTGFLPLGIMPFPDKRTVNMTAYHSDLCGSASGACGGASAFAMYASRGNVILDRSGTSFVHQADTTKGSSGAGITSDGALANKVFAINVAEARNGAYNVGLLLNEQNFETIRTWAGLR